jgi:hypothetical protein
MTLFIFKDKRNSSKQLFPGFKWPFGFLKPLLALRNVKMV